MKKQIYMRAFYPGTFVANTTTTLVDNRGIPSPWPKGAYAIQFFEQTEEMVDGEKLIGKERNFSGMYYRGVKYTMEEACQMEGENSILCSNARGNNWNSLVKHCMGGWQKLDEHDVVLP